MKTENSANPLNHSSKQMTPSIKLLHC